MSVVLVALGIVMLGLGASWLVDGACRVALRYGVSPLVVGLTIVGFGTSMPEFMVSVLAAGHGKGGLSLGNAVGSNVMNLLLVLGVAALLRPIRVVGQRHEMRRDVAFGLAPVPILMIGAWNGYIGRIEALLLLVVFGLFIGVTLSEARRNRAPRQEVEGRVAQHIGLAVVGMVVLSAGAEFLVRGGTDIARTLGISEAVIGLTLVAFGTSLPELAASVAAAVKGQSEMSIGNVLGSNVFNLGLVVGSAFAIRPSAVPTMLIRQDIPFLCVVTLVLGYGVLRDGAISRKEGAGLLTVFTAYMIFIAVRGI